MAGVILETARLALRQPTADDFEDFFALTQSEAMHRFLGGKPKPEDSFMRFLRNAGCWALYGYGPFSVFERAGGSYVGTCGLFRGMRGLGDDFDPCPEAGWVVGEASWGRGYATEVMTMILNWFDRTHGPCRSVCMIEAGNDASERIAAKLGYEPLRAAVYKTDEVMLYAR